MIVSESGWSANVRKDTYGTRLPSNRLCLRILTVTLNSCSVACFPGLTYVAILSVSSLTDCFSLDGDNIAKKVAKARLRCVVGWKATRHVCSDWSASSPGTIAPELSKQQYRRGGQFQQANHRPDPGTKPSEVLLLKGATVYHMAQQLELSMITNTSCVFTFQ